MDKVVPISKNGFFKKFSVREVDLVKAGLFEKKDVEELVAFISQASPLQKTKELPYYILFALKHPRFLKTFLFPRAMKILKFPVKKDKKAVDKSLRHHSAVSSNILKASIAASFKPKSLLEIGTYLGWGAASFKTAIPNCEVFTINPRTDMSSNNPITKKDVGSFYRKKELKIKQIWADSTQFGFSILPKIDVVYIDGSHKYKDVSKDLENSTYIARKSVIVDDYVPENALDQVYGPWNKDVVRAVDDFLRQGKKVYKHAHWIVGTPLCVLIK